MIEKILERLEERRLEYEKASENPSFEFPQKMYYKGVMRGYEYSKDVVQEVAKEHRKLNRCDTCNHYVADEVPPICYFCCKGFEDNYVAKEYGKDTKVPSRCDTCTHYVADEVPPICYMCCKGIEDNYQQKGE